MYNAYNKFFVSSTVPLDPSQCTDHLIITRPSKIDCFYAEIQELLSPRFTLRVIYTTINNNR